jgi:tRNA (guanine-N7-)-methyltransferase
MHPVSVQPPDFPANLVHTLTTILNPLDLGTLFATDQPLEVELGSGDGSFLLAHAQAHPERNFIGVERLMGRIRKLDRKGRRMGLRNLRGVRIECAYFLQYLLPPHSADALHIYFPDPWPKKRHRKYRLINEAFPTLAQNALKKDGLVHLRTDDGDYFEQMVRVFTSVDSFEPVDSPEDLVRLLTDFEKDFAAEGKQTHRASYRLKH